MRVIWSEGALEEAREYADYIALDSPMRAEKWLEDLLTEVKRLEVFPQSARVILQLDDGRFRQIIFKRFRVVFEIEEERVVILSVRRSKQKFDASDL